MRFDPGAHGVERKLAHRDPHAVRTQIAQAKYAFAVRHHDHPDILRGPMAENFLNPTVVLGSDIKAARSPEDVAVFLAGPAHGGGVNDGEHLLDMLHDHAVEERLVAVLEVHQMHVLLERVRLTPETERHAVDLVFLGEYPRRQ